MSGINTVDLLMQTVHPPSTSLHIYFTHTAISHFVRKYRIRSPRTQGKVPHNMEQSHATHSLSPHLSVSSSSSDPHSDHAMPMYFRFGWHGPLLFHWCDLSTPAASFAF